MIRKIEDRTIFLKFSFDKNKTKIYRKEQLKKFSKAFSKISFSHTKSMSVVGCLNGESNIGIDIEPRSRIISTNLLKRLQPQANEIKVLPIELWCMMEAAYKSNKKIQKDHFIGFRFKNDGRSFRLINKNTNIICKRFKYKDFVYAVALSR